MRTTLRLGLFGLVLVAPLPLGAVRDTAILGVQLWAALLGALALAVIGRDPGALPRRTRPALIIVGAMLLVPLLQIVPLPDAITSSLAPRTFELRQAVDPLLPPHPGSWTALSLAPSETLDATLRLAAYVLVGLAAAIAIRRRSHWYAAAWVIVAAGTFQAIYGSLEYLSGHQHIFGYAKEYYLDEATGTFINRNHFAGFLAVAAPFALALALRPSRTPDAVDLTWRQKLVGWSDASNLGRVLAAAALPCIWAGILLSFSRAGLVAGFVASAFVVFSSSARGRVALALAAALVLPAAYLIDQDVRTPGSRIESLDTDLISPLGRVPVWLATARMAAEQPWVGTGLGTFESAFPGYRPPTLRARWEHAHNDWLEAAAGGGLAMPFLLFALLWLCLRGSDDRDSDSARAPSLLVSGARGALVAVALHSLVDFGLRIPAMAVVVAFVAGMLLAERSLRRTGPERHEPTVSGPIPVTEVPN